MAAAGNDLGAYVYLVAMDIPVAHEAEFNSIYDTDHVPTILTVSGVRSCRRYRLESSTSENTARYLAVYEIDSPDVVASGPWLAAIDRGDWASKIRPYTLNRSHHVMRRIL